MDANERRHPARLVNNNAKHDCTSASIDSSPTGMSTATSTFCRCWALPAGPKQGDSSADFAHCGVRERCPPRWRNAQQPWELTGTPRLVDGVYNRRSAHHHHRSRSVTRTIRPAGRGYPPESASSDIDFPVRLVSSDVHGLDADGDGGGYPRLNFGVLIWSSHQLKWATLSVRLVEQNIWSRSFNGCVRHLARLYLHCASQGLRPAPYRRT